MLKMLKQSKMPDSSFLPEDYLQQKAERRTVFLMLVLCVLVFSGVIAAFFVTNQQWNDVRYYTKQINIRYQASASAIEQLKSVEDQKATLIEKAELTTALLERVPKSILFAEVINRMPKRMTLLEVELVSQRLDKPVNVRQKREATTEKGKSMVSKSSRSTKSKKGGDEEARVMAPRFETRITLVGVAPGHGEVAKFVSELQKCDLLSSVELRFSEVTMIKDHEVNKFRLEATIPTDADARRMEVLETPRMDIFVMDQGLEIMGGANPDKPVANAEDK